MNELFATVFWCGTTIAVFFSWRRMFVALKHPLLHPILWATLAIVLLTSARRASGSSLPRRIIHQREVGTAYFDEVSQVIYKGESSTTALNGSTETEQFH